MYIFPFVCVFFIFFHQCLTVFSIKIFQPPWLNLFLGIDILFYDIFHSFSISLTFFPIYHLCLLVILLHNVFFSSSSPILYQFLHKLFNMPTELLILVSAFSFPEVTSDYLFKSWMVSFNMILFLKNYNFYYVWSSFLAYENFPYFCVPSYIWKEFCYILPNISKFLVVQSVSGYPVLPIVFLLQLFLLVTC